MTDTARSKLSIVVPLYNESATLRPFHKSLLKVLGNLKLPYELIYCDDGSNDNTSEIAVELCADNSSVKLIKFSRNFGKESALSAGIKAATGNAIISIDGDGQHPVEVIPEFVKLWHSGAQTVIGVRDNTKHAGQFKRFSSWAFYKIFNKITDQELTQGSTDFRLIDRSVQQEFLKLEETDRITRGLIDWLGFRREYVYFTPKPREEGSSSYSHSKLIKLAMNSFVSLTPRPLFIFGYLGCFITLGALIVGCAVFIEQILFGDPWHWKFTGTAMLGILTVFLVGLVLLSQSILALYISHAHNQTLRRPLYIIDHAGSHGIKEA
jgi:dolichol-phosphate mannosyltransferase